MRPQHVPMRLQQSDDAAALKRLRWHILGETNLVIFRTGELESSNRGLERRHEILINLSQWLDRVLI
jgi:hypothetical protein